MFGKCAICGWYARLLVDHNHSTGDIRGYICYSCNRRLVEIEAGIHKHQSFITIFSNFVVETDCSLYHQYLRAPPLETLDFNRAFWFSK
jgi:hypothetical protein